MGDDHLLRVIHDEFQRNTAIEDKGLVNGPYDICPVMESEKV